MSGRVEVNDAILSITSDTLEFHLIARARGLTPEKNFTAILSGRNRKDPMSESAPCPAKAGELAFDFRKNTFSLLDGRRGGDTSALCHAFIIQARRNNNAQGKYLRSTATSKNARRLSTWTFHFVAVRVKPRRLRLCVRLRRRPFSLLRRMARGVEFGAVGI